jgi:hypothetical protein
MADGAHDHDLFHLATKADLAALETRVKALEDAPQPPADEQPADPVLEDPPEADPPVDPPETPQDPPEQPEEDPTLPRPDWNFHMLTEAVRADDAFLSLHMHPSSYYRSQNRIVIPDDLPLEYHRQRNPLNEGAYRLQLAPVTEDEIGGWQTVAEDSPDPTALRSRFDFDAHGLTEGLYFLRILRPNGQAGARTHVYVDHGTLAENQTFMAITEQNYTSRHGLSTSGVVPLAFDPRIQPLLPREPGPIEGNNFTSEPLVAHRAVARYIPHIDAQGRMGAETRQYYYTHQITEELPSTPIFDGPRGMAVVPPATQMAWTHTGGLWYWDAHGFRMMKPDGHFITLAGWRHVAGKAGMLELVGDWSGCPEPHGVREMWGGHFLPNSLRMENGRHLTNPRCLLFDTPHNRVLVAEFDKDTMPGQVPCKITVFADNLMGPWQGIMGADASEIVIGERFGNRLGVWKEDGTFLYYIVDGSAQAGLIDATSEPTSRRLSNKALKSMGPRQPSVAEIRQFPMIWPEGLARYEDGGRKWAYVASSAMSQCLRFEIAPGGDRQVVIQEMPDDGFANLVICHDDSVYPKGTMLVSDWTASSFGQPKPYAQNGQRIGSRFDKKSHFFGRGGVANHDYATACCVGDARIGQWGLAFTGSSLGPTRISKTMDRDPDLFYGDYVAGREEWLKRGYDVIYDPSLHSLPLPWGEDARIDTYLAAEGHARPV